MSTQSPTPTTSYAPATELGKTEGPPLTQARTIDYRARWPVWMQQLPRIRPIASDPNFKLISETQLDAILATAPEPVRQRIREDVTLLDTELTPVFREHDAQAALFQNRHRLYQIEYILLATFATILGSIQALSLAGRPTLIPLIAFGETLIALLATYLATISGREPPYPRWLDHRRKAETLRREYFRYLMNLDPYDKFDSAKPFERKYLLTQRVADVNRGMYPEERRTI